MLSYLLKEWSKTPEPWFSKRHLKELSDEQFSELVARKILLYDLPRGEESTDEHRCTHGCSLFWRSVSKDTTLFVWNIRKKEL